MGMSVPDISIIVPALNEGANLRPLTERIAAAMAGRRYEILIIDDNSKDNTPAVCLELARSYPIELVVRTKPVNGLGGAVLHGFAAARGDIFVVMDADLQHPPEKLPELLEPIENDQAEFALGSRHVEGGSTGQKWGLFRKLNSGVATLLARPFSGNAKDPMSGFFALRRETFDRGERLMPLGYKIGLELMCKCRVSKVVEIPIHFAERSAGESKLSLREQFRYLEHLSRLYDFCYPRLSPIAKFLIVLLIGWAVGLGIFVLTLQQGMRTAWSPIIAYSGFIFVTAVFHRRYIKAQREFILTRAPWREFALVSMAEWLACAAAAIWLATRVAGHSPVEMFLIPFAAGTIVRYMLRKELMHDIRGLRRELR
ncbi:MAG TPA: glycosyltransferase, partial [Tepidisphaeraceae bacterium]|nr:glycosyltransferase [Tepidisphaeraceae bacterium]